jgi:predicted RNA-binding Zn ribbon-like protein
METHGDVTRMRIVGGNLALDLVNTRTGPPSGPTDDELFDSYEDLIGWALHIGAVTDPEAHRLRRAARRDPVAARDALKRTLRTRDHLDATFRAIAAGRRPPARSMAALRTDEATALQHADLDQGNAGFTWSWANDRSLERPVRPAVHAAIELLTSGPMDRIKACGGCRFLFVDESKNRSRRWCSMDDCGTAEKMRRYVTRRRRAKSTVSEA